MDYRLFPFRVFLLSLGLSGAPFLPMAAAQPARGPVRIAARSGSGYETWDLGADPARPGNRIYRAAIGGGAPFKGEFDGATSEFRYDDGAGRWLTLRSPALAGPRFMETPALAQPGARAVAAPAPLAGPGWRHEGGGIAARIPGGAHGWEFILRLAPGLMIRVPDARTGIAGAGLQLLDANGVPFFAIGFPESKSGALALTALDGEDFRVTIAADDRALGAGRTASSPMLSLLLTPQNGTWGGYECNQGTGPGTAFNANPWGNVYAGEFNNVVYPRYTCDGYISWPLTGLLPPTAVVTVLRLNPLNVANNFVGAAQTVHLVDVSTPLPFANSFNAAIWSDLNTMTPAVRVEYGAALVTGLGNVAAPVVLGQSALDDANAALRTGLGYFAIGFYTPPIAQNNYFTFSSSASTLEITYSAAPNTQIVLNRLHLDAPLTAGKGFIDVYNYGDDADLSGWKISSVNFNSAAEAFTLPVGTLLPRHKRLMVLDQAGTNTASQLYTGGNVFHWGKTPAPNNVTVALSMADGSGADYACWGGAVPAPPAGTGWTGGCQPGAPGEGGDISRFRDADTDTSADWLIYPLTGTPSLLPGQYGTRRRSEIFINRIRVASGLNWIALVNYGPAADLQNGSLVFYDGAGGQKIYPFAGAAPMNPGDVMWLAGGAFFGVGANPPADNLHRNLGFDPGWDVGATPGGEAILRDAGNRGRDYAVFGMVPAPHLPADLVWQGPAISLGGSNLELSRQTDLTTNSAAGWFTGGFVATWGGLNPNQQGASRAQNEIGGLGQNFTNPGDGTGAVGSGAVIQVSRQVALEDIAFEAKPASGPRNGKVVVKLQGGGIVYTGTLAGIAAGAQIIRSGRINPPLVLNPGTYAIMLYLDGAWSDNERYNSTERMTFATVQGVTTEPGFIPSAAFTVSFPNYGLHTYLTTINPPTVIDPVGTPTGEVTIPFSQTYTANSAWGGLFTWTIIAGSLPPGLTLSTLGVVTGTPTASGDYTFTLQVQDGAGLQANSAQTISINKTVKITTTTLPDGNIGYAYSQKISTSGGVGPRAWSVSAGSLPPGLSISSSGGTVSGTPTVLGVYSFIINATDSIGATATQAYTVTIFNAPPFNASVPGSYVGEVGVAVNVAFTASGGILAYTWSLLGGVMPAGLTFSAAAGTITGTPTQAAQQILHLQVQDSTTQPGAQVRDFQNYSFKINLPLQVANGFLPGYTGGNAQYKLLLSAAGGTAITGWSCTFPAAFGAALTCAMDATTGFWYMSGTLPAALADGSYPLTLQVTDSLGVVASRNLTLVVNRALRIITYALQSGAVGFDYGVQLLQAAGGSGVSQWSLSAGSLPPGLYLDPAAGTLTGVPSAAGSFTPTLTYANAGGRVSRVFTISVVTPTVPPYWIRRGLAGGSAFPTFSPAFAQDQTIIARNSKQIFLSQDGGYFWRSVPFPQPPTSSPATYIGDYVSQPAFAPNFDGRPASDPNRPAGASYTFVIPRYNSGVWFTDDFGQTWTQINNGLGSNFPNSVRATHFYFSPAFATDHRMYCKSYSTANKIFTLFSGVINPVTKAITWAPLSPLTPNFRAIFISPNFAADTTFFAMVATSWSTPIYKSADGGVSWSQSGAVPVPAYTLRFSPNFATDRTLAVMDGSYDPITGLSAANGFFLSHDGGATFTLQAAGHRISDVRFPANYSPGGYPRYYLTEFLDPYYFASQMLYTIDDGATVVAIGGNGLPTGQYGGSFELSPNFLNDRLIITNGNASPGIFRSDDGGTTWSQSDGGMNNLLIETLVHAPDYASSGRIFLGTYDGAYFSGDRGRTWTRATMPYLTNVLSIRPSPNFTVDRKVFAYACASFCSLLRSTDGGSSYTEVSQQPFNLSRPDEFQISPNFAVDHMLFITDSNAIYSASSPLYRSSDEGLSFTGYSPSIGSPPQSVVFSQFGVSPGFAGDHALFSFDTNTWQPVLSLNGNNPDGGGGPAFIPDPVPALHGDGNPPFFPRDFDLVGGVNGLSSHTFAWNCLKTVNGGVTYTPMPASGPGCNEGDYNGSLAFSPNYASDSTIFSSVTSGNIGNPSPSGLFKSTNGGNTFTQLTVPGNPYAFSYVYQISLSPNFAADLGVLVATDNGLYSSNDAGATWTKSTGTEEFPPDVSAVVQDRNRAGGLFVGTLSGRVYQSGDDGFTASDITDNLPGVAIKSLLTAGTPVTRLLAATAQGIYQRTDFTASGAWQATGGSLGDIRSFGTAGATLYAARADGSSLTSTDNGVTWTVLGSQLADGNSISYSALTGPTSLVSPGIGNLTPAASQIAAGNQASLWSASNAAGAFYSSNGGGLWTAAPGANDYTLPAATGWSVVQALGVNQNTTGREVVIGNNNSLLTSDPAKGVFLSRDGGATWRNVSGAGSGLEATSKNVSAVLSTLTAFSTTDVLVGINGSTTGGVYLSGDAGEHWTQVNAGFDPNNLSISSLVTTSCGGCPVQYYSGSYGGGMYTRTITVVAPPFYGTPATWCAGAGCTCGGSLATLPVNGGTPFKICGSYFQNGLAVEFDGAPASGCTQSGGNTITCTASPAHVNGASVVRVRNPDTRTGYLPAGACQFSGGVSRTLNTLKITKSSANAVLSWTTCTGCSGSAPARVYRAQNPAFSLYLEQYNGGIGGAYTNTNAVGSAQNYFWTVE